MKTIVILQFMDNEIAVQKDKITSQKQLQNLQSSVWNAKVGPL